MTVKMGRYIVRRDGVEVDATGNWSIGPAVSSAQVAGVDATLTWHRTEPVSVLEKDYEDENYDGSVVTIDWVDEEGETRVFTGTVDTSSGASLEESTSRLTDGTERLSRTLDLRPMAYTLPVHPMLAGHGGNLRHVGLFGVWFTHQAMVQAGFDPGVPMHWSAVWYQSMCGSVATVPDRMHAYASLGDLRQARRSSDPAVAPGFVQDENQLVAEDVFAFGVTSKPRAGTENLPWQMTWDLPLAGVDGEIVLRNLATSAGIAVKWSTNNMSFYKHNETGTQALLGTVTRDRSSNGDKRWSVVVAPSGSTVIVRTDARGEVARWEGPGTVNPLPTGPNGLCTVREDVPSLIGPVAVTRGDRNYMTTEPPKGKILRDDLTATSLPGFPNMPGMEAGRILADQADAHRGLRGQPLWQWIDEHGLLINTDFDTLAARPVTQEFDTRPASNDLALDKLAWHTEPAGGPWSAVEVTAKRLSVARRDRPSLLLAQGSAQGLEHGDDYEVFLHPETGTTWLEPDLRPLMAGYPYPSPPYDPRYKNNLNREEKSWLGGHRMFADGGERRGWLMPYQMGWTVDALGHVQGAMTQLDPETILIVGKALLPQGQWPQEASTSPDPGSQGLSARRKEQPFPQLRGYGLMTELEAKVNLPIEGVDDRHAPFTHDCGLWIQSNTGMTRIGSYLHENIARPTPMRTAQVEATGRVKAGEKVLLRERRRDGIMIEEEIVVTPIEGSTNSSDDSMTITGVVTARRVTQTDPEAPPVDVEEEWITPPPVQIPEPPPSTDPPIREDDPPGEEPGLPPAKPSTPEIRFDAHGVLVVTWDGKTAAGTDAVDAAFGVAEVALEKVSTPTEVVGSMWVMPGETTFEYQEPSIDYGTKWWTRIRVVDRWGQVSEWSDVDGPVEVVPLVDPIQFEELRELLDETAIWVAESGAELSIRMATAEDELDAAEGRLEDAETSLELAEGQIADAQAWIALTGAQLGTRLNDAETDLSDAQTRLDDAETAINTTFPTQIAGLADDVIGIHQEISAIQTATGQKIVTSPTAPNPAETDIWIDTSGTPAVPKFYNGTTWEPLTDPDAIADALAAAKAHADAMPKVLHGTSAAAGNAPNGTVWFQHVGSISGAVIAQWTRVGGNWVSTPIDSRAIANLDVGKLTAGSADIHTLVAQKIAAASAQFIDLDVENLIVTGSSTMDENVVNKLWADVVRSRKITTDMLVVGSGENIFPDPFFQDTDGWDTPNVSVQPSAGAPGGNRMVIGPSTASQYSYYQNSNYRGLQFKAGGTYKLRYKARMSGSTPHPSTMRFYVRYDDAGGTTRSRSWVIPYPETSTEWRQYESDFTVPDDYQGGATVAFWRSGLEGITNSSVLIADVSLVSMADASLIVDGAITAEKITIVGDKNNPDEAGLVANIASIMDLSVENLTATGTTTLREAVVDNLWTNVVRSRKITTDMLVVGKGVNLIPNGDIALGTEGWANSNWGLNQTNAKAIGYPGSLWLNGRVSGLGASYFPIEGGKRYKFTVWARGDRAGKRFYVQFLTNGTGNPYGVANELTTTAWKKFEGVVTMPDDVTEIRVQVYANHTNGTTTEGYQWFTGFHLAEDAASLIVDGAIAARHINTLSIAAEVGNFIKINANQITTGAIVAGQIATGAITAGKIAAGAITADKISSNAITSVKIAANAITAAKIAAGAITASELSATAIDGKTITGAHIRSSAAPWVGGGVRILPQGITIWGADGTERVQMRPDLDRFEMRGIFKATSNNGQGVEVRPPSGGIGGWLNFTDPSMSNAAYIATGGTSEAATPRGTLSMISAATQSNQRRGRIRLEPGGNIYIGQAATGSSGTERIYLNMASGQHIQFFQNEDSRGIQMGSAGTTGVQMQASGSTQFWVQGSMIRAPGIWRNTSTGTSNVAIYSNNGGELRRVTSLRAAKKDIKPLSVSAGEAFYQLEPVTWLDSVELARGEARGRYMGFIAEQVAEVEQQFHLEGLTVKDEDGALNSVAYDRLLGLAVHAIRDLNIRLTTMEDRNE